MDLQKVQDAKRLMGLKIHDDDDDVESADSLEWRSVVDLCEVKLNINLMI